MWGREAESDSESERASERARCGERADKERAEREPRGPVKWRSRSLARALAMPEETRYHRIREGKEGAGLALPRRDSRAVIPKPVDPR